VCVQRRWRGRYQSLYVLVRMLDVSSAVGFCIHVHHHVSARAGEISGVCELLHAYSNLFGY
jgi:hypothetical protein